MASVEISTKLFKERLKCKICESGLKAGKSRWFRCLKNHQVCEDCQTKNKKCPNPCGKPISEEHCEIIEDLLKAKSMRFSCSNESRGCQESSSEEAIINHEAECTYRLVKCPRINCDEKVPFRELLDHLKPSRGCKVMDVDLYNIFNRNPPFRFRIDKPSFDIGDIAADPIKITYNGKVFFLVSEKYPNQQNYRTWIQMYGSKYEAKNYFYTVKLHGNDQNPNVSSTFTAQVIPIDEDPTSILNGNNYFGIDFKVFKELFMNQDRLYKVSVELKNMKEEAKDDNNESGISDH